MDDPYNIRKITEAFRYRNIIICKLIDLDDSYNNGKFSIIVIYNATIT